MIRKATEADAGAVAAIYGAILDLPYDIGWVRGVYPTIKTAEAALERGDLFVCDDGGKIKASAVINKIQVPEYALGRWKYPAPDDKIMVMHTLTVDPAYAGRGIGGEMIKFYEEYARADGCTVLRIDTNAKNSRARAMYAHLGYEEIGAVPCTFNGIAGVSLVLLEKKL